MAETIIIRVQSPEGVKRITATKRETVGTFLKKVAKEFGFRNNGFSVYTNRNRTGEITAAQNKSLNLLKIKHGDMLFLYPSSPAGSSSETMDTSVSQNSRPGGAPQVVEDEIDQYLIKQDGKIYRNRDQQLCRHGPLGKCVHCVPLEPFDEDYLNHLEPPVKHMSFHAYIRKLTGGADKGKFVALENISCKIKSGCEGHPPWPEGICTKCQPSAITLNRQKYRHVDNIMFENHTIADRFLDFWRKTGNQHLGYLYGRYTEHKDIPLGIRAEVAAIYEPPQIGTQNSLEILEDPKAEVVDEIAAKLGLRKVGWIFTDLVSEDTRKGTVRYSRNKDTYFLSAEECITAGNFQNQQPNICRLSPDGHFGSKFVTVVATGGPDNQVHFEGYQVSNQCMALVRDECLLPCRDAPELGYAKESSSEQYVPDVFYKVRAESLASSGMCLWVQALILRSSRENWDRLWMHSTQWHGVVEWFGLGGALRLIPFHPLPPSTIPGCFKPHPTWTWTLTGLGQPQLLWVNCQGLILLTGKNSFPISHPALPSGSGKPLPLSCHSTPSPKSLSRFLGAPLGTGRGSQVSLETSPSKYLQVNTPSSELHQLHVLPVLKSPELEAALQEGSWKDMRCHCCPCLLHLGVVGDGWNVIIPLPVVLEPFSPSCACMAELGALDQAPCGCR